MSNETNATMQDIEESPGVISMMRKGVKSAIKAGWTLIIASFLLSVGMLWKNEFQLIPVVVAMASTGPTLILGALGAKAWQAQAENVRPPIPSYGQATIVPLSNAQGR